MGPYPALFVLDEFPTMPKLKAIIEGPAVGRGQKVSYLLIGQVLNYRPTNQTEYDWDGAMNIVHAALDYYIKALEEALGTSVGLDPDVENLLQEYLRYWKKENNYKNKARMEDMGTDE